MEQRKRLSFFTVFRNHLCASIHKITFSRVMLYIIMIGLVVFTSLPLIYVICTAFKPLNELFIYPPRFYVKNPTSENFSDLFNSLSLSAVPFTRYIFNSLLTTTLTVFLTVTVCSMGAYGLAKHKPKGSNVIFAFILGALMFSPHVTQIPRYLVVNQLGLINNYAALIIPNIAVAYNFFLMKQFVEQFPTDLIEASRIDGAGEYRIFSGIVMPALKPAWCTFDYADLCFDLERLLYAAHIYHQSENENPSAGTANHQWQQHKPNGCCLAPLLC